MKINKRVTMGIIMILIILFQIQVVRGIEPEKIITIDPGHGGMDGGAVSKNGTSEKNINLNIALEIRKILIEKGYKVVMTRDEDKALYKKESTIRNEKIQDLTERVRIKNESGCQMFLSIHLNSFPMESVYGPVVWHGDNTESKKMAEILQNNLLVGLNVDRNLKAKPAKGKYKILRNSQNRAEVIIECGFLSNYNDEKKLKTKEYQKKLSEIISKSIEQYYIN